MKLPSEILLWKMAAIGFGLISGVAVISIMNQINYMLHPVSNYGTPGNNVIISEYFSNKILLLGKLISNVSGTFFAAAIARLFNSSLGIKSAVIIGFIFMILGFIDVMISFYPNYYTYLSLLLYIPSALFGYYFIKKFQLKSK